MTAADFPRLAGWLNHPRVTGAVRAASGVLGTAAELLWPSCCVGCDTPLEPGGSLCTDCAGQPMRLTPPFCAVCSRAFADDGAPMPPDASSVCADCRAQRFAFECAVHFCRHDGLARDLVIRFKYGGEHYLRRPLSGWLVETLRSDERLLRQPVDALVPVPLHRRRERERGFNQAEALCRRVGRETGLPVWLALRRMRATRTQTHLSRAERQSNLRGAFALVPRHPVTGAHLLLVDDVYTTGSTVHECARVLRRAGAASVRVLTVTRR